MARAAPPPAAPRNATAPAWLRRLPNALTLFRLLLAAAFPFVAPGWRLAVALAAGISDSLDGWIARRFDAQSRLGALLDGVADKAFLLAVLGTLFAHAEVAWWQAVLVLLRDVVVVVALGAALVHRDLDAMQQVDARLPGKLTTTFLFAWFVTLFLAPLAPLEPWLFVLSAVCSAWAAWDYGRRGLDVLRGQVSAPDRSDPACER